MSVALAFDRVDGARPERTIAFLHGILGRGSNLRTLAKRFVEARPEWSAWLIDLRGHGASPKSTAKPSLEAAARDVLDLVTRADLPLNGIVGHSFGGKVALEAARLAEIVSLRHVMAIDSMPGSRTPFRTRDSALSVIDTLESMPPTFSSKTDFANALMAAGKSRTVAQWLASSTEREKDHVRVAFDLNEVRALLQDYFARDLWPLVEHPPDGMHIHLVIADRSTSYPEAERDRAQRIAKSTDRVTVDILPAGHWVHVDDPDGLLRVMTERLHNT